MYWSMRMMAFLGVLLFLVAAVGAWLYRRRTLEKTRWFLRTAVVAIAFPFLAATAGWVLTEMGRQPWIVQDLLQDLGRPLAERLQRDDRREPRRVRRCSTSCSASSTSSSCAATRASTRRRCARGAAGEPALGY